MFSYEDFVPSVLPPKANTLYTKLLCLLMLLASVLVWLFFGASSAAAAGTVGNGTPASCTETALNTALAGGGAVTFNCGSNPFTITLRYQKILTTSTSLDGGNLITLSGSGDERLFATAEGSLTSFRNITLTNGYAQANGGGAIYSQGELHIENSKFYNNLSAAWGAQGGAIYGHTNSGPAIITNSTFISNSAFTGGAVFQYNAPIFISQSTFMSNTGSGAAIFASYSTLHLSNSLITHNNGTELGAIGGASAIVTNTTFTYNEGTTGGAFALSSLRISDSLVAYNTGYRRAGGIYAYTSLDMYNTQVLSNTTLLGGYGGGLELVYSLGGSFLIANSTIAYNSAQESGGGIAARDGTALTIQNSAIYSNSALINGGGVAMSDNSILKVSNSTISQNSAIGKGGGIYNSSKAKTTVANSTIALNKTQSNGGGLYMEDALVGPITLTNSIVANNAATDCNTLVINAGNNINSDGSCGFAGVDAKLGALADNGGTTKTHALLPGSPAIDGGNSSAAPSTDQRGVGRPLDGNNDGMATTDIGAYEFNPTFCSPAVNPTVVTATGDNGTGAVCGTLSHALGYAGTNYNGVPLTTTVTFALSGANSITFTTPYALVIPQGVTIKGKSDCSNPNLAVTIDGTGVNGDGLQLQGNNMIVGLVIKGFSGRLLTTIGTNNQVLCSKFSK